MAVDPGLTQWFTGAEAPREHSITLRMREKIVRLSVTKYSIMVLFVLLQVIITDMRIRGTP